LKHDIDAIAIGRETIYNSSLVINSLLEAGEMEEELYN
jgi:hypothetical protein